MTTKPIPTIDWMATVGPRQAVFGDRRENIVHAARATESISQIVVAGDPIVVVNSPDYAQELLVAKAQSFHSGKPKDGINRRMFGNGLVIREGEAHRQSRKEINPAFDRRHLALYAEEMAGCAERAVERWKDGAEIDSKQEMYRLMFDILGRTFFGKDLLEKDRTAGDSLVVMTTAAFGEMPSPFRILLGRLTRRNDKVARAIGEASRTISQFIQERRASAADHDDMLGVLLRSKDAEGEPLGDEDVHDAIMSLITGAYITTANALAWMWYLVAHHPSVLKTLQDEVDNALSERRMEFDDIAKLPYALQVFKESQRLFPLGSTISRRAIADVPIDGYVIPKGALIWVSTYVMHRNPAVFPDPEAFRPERFDTQNEGQMPRHAYMPFSVGPRLCIGRHFAELAGQVSAAVIARRVTLTPVEKELRPVDRQVDLLHTGSKLTVSCRAPQQKLEPAATL